MFHDATGFAGRCSSLAKGPTLWPGPAQVQVLRGVTLDIEPGQVVALVGSSGSGKSSILKLIEQLYEPSKGSLLLDGRDLRQYDDGWLKRHVAFVGQEVLLVSWLALTVFLIERRVCKGFCMLMLCLAQPVPHTLFSSVEELPSSHMWCAANTLRTKRAPQHLLWPRGGRWRS